nr:DUF2213 domain-containing protein [Sphingomonas sp.]
MGQISQTQITLDKALGAIPPIALEAGRRGVHRLPNGWMLAVARVTRAGMYQASEAEFCGAPMVYRPPEEVFAQASLESYADACITLKHPAHFPNHYLRDDPRRDDCSVGRTLGIGVRVGNFVEVPFLITDPVAIWAVESGMSAELSVGQRRAFFSWETDQFTPAGDRYRHAEGDIRVDHIALVERGRMGPECRVETVRLNGLQS